MVTPSMRASGHFTFALAAILCFGAVIAAAHLQSDEAIGGPDLSGTVDPYGTADPCDVESSHDAVALATVLAELPTADRRASEARGLALPRLSQLPRACSGAAAEVSSASSNAEWATGDELPNDDRLRLSRSLVTQHIRLQV